MPESHAHPSPELLQCFGSGELPALEAAAIQRHIETCAGCCQRLRDPAGQPPNESTGAFTPATASFTENVAPLPARVGRYHLEQELARGGMGQVVRVTDEVFQRPLAMKIALGSDQTSLDTHERFVREALLTGQLQHPGIPPVQELGQLPDGRPYFIMKLVKGSDLRNLLRLRSSVGAELPRMVAIFEQICQTLGYVHAHGIIHRDLKPANIMVGAFGEVQVMDWGLAKSLTPEGKTPERTQPRQQPQPNTVFTVTTPNKLPRETVPGTVMGTTAYMPPEQARGESETLDPRCDVFGLGAILCEVLTGQPPFTEKTSIENQRRSMKGDLSDALARLNACGADAELVDLAKRCLAPDRADRPAQAGVVAEAVARYQAALQERRQQAEIDKAAALVKVREERKRRRVSLALAAALVVLIVGGSACALWYQGEITRQDEDKFRQDADKRQQDAKLALRRDYLNKEVSVAVTDAEQRRTDLLKRLANQRQVNELLSDIDQWQTTVKEAQAACRRARALADGSRELVEKALAERLRQLEDNLQAAEKDWKFAKACDDARLAADTLVEEKRDSPLAAQQYPGIFAAAGLDVVQGNADGIVAHLKKSPIRLVYLAALDHWADVADPKLLSRLFSIANQADTDAWRKQFRNVQLWKDQEQLQRLADKVDCQQQSPQVLLALVHRLLKNREGGVRLLRQALADHPRDFWIFIALGRPLTDPVASEGFFRAALAIRPLSMIAHNNLGVALTRKKDVDGAIQHLRKALAINPNEAAAHLNLGVSLRDKKDVAGATKHFLKARDIDPNFAAAYLNLGVLLYDKKDVAGAIKLFRKALDLKPDFAGAYVNLGKVQLDKKDVEGAIQFFRKAIDSDPNYDLAYLNLGAALYAKNDVAGSIQQCRKALDINPNYAEAHTALATALYTKKDVAGAITHCRKALAINPNLDTALITLGLALSGEDVEEAIKLYHKALDSNPNSDRADINLGVILMNARKDVAGAIKHFRKAIELNPNFAPTHVYLGRALYAKEDVAGAIEQYRKAIELNPNLADARNQLGHALYAKKDVAGAIEQYRKALDSDPTNAEAHVGIGFALRDKKDVAGAIRHFRMALDSNPKDANSHYQLGHTFYAQKDVEGAIRHYRQAIEINPNLADAHVNLAAALNTKKDSAGAIQHCLKALDINPKDLGAHINLGNALRDKKDVAGAIRHFRQAIEINPNSGTAHHNLGLALHDQKDVAEAMQHYRRAIEINPNSDESHYSLGRALDSMKDMAGAMQHYSKAVAINPNNAMAQLNLGALLYNEKKDAAGAIQHFRKVLENNPNDPLALANLGVTYPALGRALLVKGQLAEVRAAMLEWLKLLPAGHPQRKLAQEQLQRCDRLLALDQQLTLILKGGDSPNQAAELLALADLCVQCKHYYAAAARFYAAALLKEPKLAEDLPNSWHYRAAGAAALAGAGKGKDADQFQEQDRAKFRQQALDWLRADLALWRKQSQSGNVLEVLLLTQKLSDWQRDPKLASERDAQELAGLPKQEQQPWRQLWAEVTQLLKETKGRFRETQHPGTLTAKETEQVHEVKLLAGKTYVLDLQSTQFDTFLRLQDAQGKVLAENDDISPQDQNSRLVFSPKQVGVYRIIATSFQQRGNGAYTLTIREFADPLATKDAAPKSP